LISNYFLRQINQSFEANQLLLMQNQSKF